MRTAVALALVLAVGVPGFADDDEKYKSKTGKYTVAFPAGKVKEVNSTTAGGLATEQAVITVRGRTFEVIYADLPDDAASLPVKTLFDGGEKGALKGDKKLVASQDFTFGPDKLPAREITVKDGEKMDRALMILKKTRIYVVTVSGPNNFTTAKEAYAFFESFEITK